MIQIKSLKRGKQIAADENRGLRGNWISPFGKIFAEQSRSGSSSGGKLFVSDPG
jgi:hypothetical protein